VDVGLAARYRQKIILYAMKVAHVPSYYFFLQPVVVFKRKCEGWIIITQNLLGKI